MCASLCMYIWINVSHQTLVQNNQSLFQTLITGALTCYLNSKCSPIYDKHCETPTTEKNEQKVFLSQCSSPPRGDGRQAAVRKKYSKQMQNSLWKRLSFIKQSTLVIRMGFNWKAMWLRDYWLKNKVPTANRGDGGSRRDRCLRDKGPQCATAPERWVLQGKDPDGTHVNLPFTDELSTASLPIFCNALVLEMAIRISCWNSDLGSPPRSVWFRTIMRIGISKMCPDDWHCWSGSSPALAPITQGLGSAGNLSWLPPLV